jgi:hypothetical protein
MKSGIYFKYILPKTLAFPPAECVGLWNQWFVAKGRKKYESRFFCSARCFRCFRACFFFLLPRSFLIHNRERKGAKKEQAPTYDRTLDPLTIFHETVHFQYVYAEFTEDVHCYKEIIFLKKLPPTTPHCLDTAPELPAGLGHGVPHEVGHQLRDLGHQRGSSVVGVFVNIPLNKSTGLHSVDRQHGRYGHGHAA